jgi:hypothetical protein
MSDHTPTAGPRQTGVTTTPSATSPTRNSSTPTGTQADQSVGFVQAIQLFFAKYAQSSDRASRWD